jgi:site-specific DNA-methyltransferase (adenine-specific)
LKPKFSKDWDDTKTNPISILEFSNSNHNKFHPTQKPVTLLEYLIKTYTNENETVIDNCMGSGSTGVACVNLNRSFIGIEKELEYFKIAENRINKAIEEKAGLLL